MVALLTLAGAPARAADPGGSCTPDQVDCDVWDDDPPVPGGGGNDGGGGGNEGGGGGNDGGTAKCQWESQVVKCYDDILGWFNNADGCYYKLASPQDPAPEGQQWYTASCNGGLGNQVNVLLAAPPPGFGTPPDPEELARRALASISLLPPRTAVAPRRSKGPGLVGLPVWMWASPGNSYFGPLHASASERGLTVEITATVNRIVWHMADGLDVECDGPGTPYKADGPRAGSASPDCGLPNGYPKADTYRVYATAYWTVEWSSSGGESGEIAQTRTSGVIPVQINELQVVTR
ncbi:hypothetical protein O7602_27985 [Micromonospora sp. WMMD1128]|uniref:hypothetical protein n=1 Tax=Micromonospora sp. WMMD1128 TaxID=3015150 RepID=UPI00248C35BD|nr:hypothetical protein [Micromonospora sp. WMMD1128]WBB77200.1 hypothetical protein O7602_27985 [Micromonospora sp. WMMD1128]